MKKEGKCRLVIEIAGEKEEVNRAISYLSGEANTVERLYGVTATPDVEGG